MASLSVEPGGSSVSLEESDATMVVSDEQVEEAASGNTVNGLYDEKRRLGDMRSHTRQQKRHSEGLRNDPRIKGRRHTKEATTTSSSSSPQGPLTLMEEKARIGGRRKKHVPPNATSDSDAMTAPVAAVQPGAVWEGGSQPSSSSARTHLDRSVIVPPRPVSESIDSTPRVAVAEIVDEQSLEDKIRARVAQEAVHASVLTRQLSENRKPFLWRRPRYMGVCLILLLIVVVAVVASVVVVAQVGGSPDAVTAAVSTPQPSLSSALRSNRPSYTPTKSPTVSVVPSLTPTASPTVTPPCVETLTALFETEERITDVSVSRRYVLCPATTYRIDRFIDLKGNIANTVDDFNNTAGFQHPLFLRPNLLVQCGDSGSIVNNCVFAGGDYSVLAQGPPRRGETLHNVVIKGMRFVDAQRVAVLLQQAGDVTFVDCSFKTTVGSPPVLIRYSGRTLFDRALRGHGNEEGGVARNLQRVNPTLSVTFENCTFVGNSNLNLNSSWPGLITVEGDLVREVVVRGCLLQDNSYPFDESRARGGYIINNAEGSLLTLERNCFVNNQVEGPGLIQHTGSDLDIFSRDNYVSNGSTVGALDCSFVAYQFAPGVPFECLAAELDACAL